jgi:1,2-diacylglycerol 3-beta-galactosyltransferase
VFGGWNSSVDKCFVPTDVLNAKARSRGLNPSQIMQYGLPIRKGFWVEARHNNQSTLDADVEPRIGLVNKILGRRGKVNVSIEKDAPRPNSLRSSLGIDDELPCVLVVGGGDGMGGIVEIAKALGVKLGSSGAAPSYQLVVVCGNNEAAQKQLSNEKWGPGVKVSIKGFVNNMDEWMRASDALVTKAGPGTIAEASICGLPCMLFAYL